jgi:hypothetical protein
MLVSFLAAAAAAIILITVAQTLIAYPSLPNRVPLGLAWNGAPRGFGPRPMIWLIVAVQIFAACIMAYADYAIATHQPGAHGTLLGSLIASVGVFAMLWRGQMLMISSAKSGGSPVPMNGFFSFLAVGMSIVLFAAFVIH